MLKISTLKVTQVATLMETKFLPYKQRGRAGEVIFLAGNARFQEKTLFLGW